MTTHSEFEMITVSMAISNSVTLVIFCIVVQVFSLCYYSRRLMLISDPHKSAKFIRTPPLPKFLGLNTLAFVLCSFEA